MGNVLIENVRKKYGAFEVLHGIDVAVEHGEFLVLVGPSGCGKSTLLRMIAGLESISSGGIKIGEQIVNDLPPKKRDIAMVFQSYALYPHMTVAENMGFSLKLRSVPKPEIANQVAEAAEILDLTPLLDRKPKQLSGGQRQRVAMGRAIVRDPAVFLFDEPLSNLDAKLRVQMRAQIKSLHQRLGSTIIYVTHDQIEAMTMADRIVVMNGGRIEQIGTPLELFDHPNNAFVAQFIGSPSMNILNGTIRQGDRLGFELQGGGHIDLTGADLTKYAGRQISLGIRPEHLSIGADAGNITINASVLTIEPMGSETLVHATVGTNDLVASIGERISAQPGQDLPLSFDVAQAHFFDAENGERLV